MIAVESEHSKGVIHSKLNVLRTDASGIPYEWINYRDVARLYALDQVLYPMGNQLFEIWGGMSSKTHRQSVISIHSIVCTAGQTRANLRQKRFNSPPLNNKALFRRDAYLCLYCGKQFDSGYLSRDHVNPLSRGGKDVWANCATACKRCNHRKGNQTLKEGNMELIAIPFTPSHAEYIYLCGCNILLDQMNFLFHYFPKNSRLYTPT